jgi:hypothetical protein
MGVHRAGILGQHVHYTAQTGKDARARWTDLKTIIEKSPIWRGRYKVSLRGGAEAITFHGNAGFHCFAPGPNCLHGYTPHVVCLDEAFAHDPERGDMLMGAISPAQQTILARQIWIVSTAGTAESTFLHDWIDRGLNREPRVALFLWGASDEHNPYDLDDIAGFHPGVGFKLNEKVLTAADVLGEVTKNSKAEYERAFANRRTLTRAHLISPDTWRAMTGNIKPPEDTRDITLAYDVGFDRLSSTITAQWTTRDGRPAAKVVQAGPGVDWLVDAVDDLIGKWRPRETVAAGNGDAIAVTARLRARGRDVVELSEREYAMACGRFLTLVDDAALVHDDEAVFEQSVTGLVTRPGAVDGVAFSRRHSVGDASAGVAAAVGLWALTRDTSTGKPLVRFAS